MSLFSRDEAPPVTVLAAAGLFAELGLFALVFAAWLESAGYTLAEAGAVAILLTFVAVSLVHQVDLLAGSPWPGVAMEILLLGAAAASFFRRPIKPGLFVSAGRRGFLAAPVPAALLGAAWLAMAALAVVSGSRVSDLQIVSRLAQFHPTAPLNTVALFFHAGRIGLPPGACGIGVLAHVAVGLATYALARRYAFPPMAMTVCLVVVSIPRLVFLGLHPTAEMMTTAAAVVAVLLLFRLVEQHRPLDFWFFLVAAFFAVDADPVNLILALVLLLLLVVVMIRRHGWVLCRRLITDRPRLAALMLAAAVLTAQLPVFFYNASHGQPLFGVAIAFDTDGIRGAAANLLRYLLVCIDPTAPLDRLFHWLVGLDLKGLVMGLHRLIVTRVFGLAGATEPFDAVFSGGGRIGFGPIAPLLILPAMGYALIHGTRRLKAVSVAWIGYLYLAALVVAWQPSRLSVLSPLFASGGVMVAFSLPPWRLRRRGRRLIQTLTALLIAGSLVWAMAGPAIAADGAMKARGTMPVAGLGVEKTDDLDYNRGCPAAGSATAAAAKKTSSYRPERLGFNYDCIARRISQVADADRPRPRREGLCRVRTDRPAMDRRSLRPVL